MGIELRFEITDKCVLKDVSDKSSEIFNDCKKLLQEATTIYYDEVLEKAMRDSFPIEKKNYRAYLEMSTHESIDTDSNAFIDLDNKIATPPIVIAKYIPMIAIKVDGRACDSVTGSHNAKDLSIELYSREEANTISIDIISPTRYSYHIRTMENEYTGSSTRRVDVGIATTKGSFEITIRFEKYSDFIVNNISLMHKELSDTGSISSREFKVYKDVSVLNVLTDGADCSYLLGVYNKELKDFMYLDASKPVSFIKDIVSMRNATSSTPFFGSEHLSLKQVCDIPKKANTGSISLYRGYNRFEIVIARGAMVSEDLSSIEYNPSDITKSGYVDIDNLNISMVAGDLVTLKQKVLLRNTTRIRENITTSNDIEVRVIIGDDSILSRSIDVEAQEGLNDVTIVLYKRKKNAQDTTKESVYVDFNMRKNSSFIYSYKLREGIIDDAIENGDLFCLTDKIITRDVTGEDSFLVTYNNIGTDNYRFEDEKGQYVRVILKAIFNSSRAYLRTMLIK